MRSHLLCLTTLLLGACSSSGAEPPAEPTPDPPDTPLEADSVAYFAGGCFWGVEHYMEQLDGVSSVESGYMGGHLSSPSYEDVIRHGSGHLEAVEVRFDSHRVSYEAVAKLFFEIHDPTQEDGQGPDIGAQYLSAVFYTSPEQLRTSEVLIERLRARGFDVATELRQAEQFWKAEDYHQDYYSRTGKTPYCHARVDRFGD